MKKKHKVKSLEDICNLLNEDNFEILAEDVRIWVISYHVMLQKLRNDFPKETKGKLNTEIAKGSFVWVDDGKNDFLGYVIEKDRKKK